MIFYDDGSNGEKMECLIKKIFEYEIKKYTSFGKYYR